MPRLGIPVVAYPDGLQLCPACQLWFAINPKQRNPAIYCSASCRSASFKLRQEQEAAALRAARRRRPKSAA